MKSMLLHDSQCSAVQYEFVVQYSFSYYSGILHSGWYRIQKLKFDIFWRTLHLYRYLGEENAEPYLTLTTVIFLLITLSNTILAQPWTIGTLHGAV